MGRRPLLRSEERSGSTSAVGTPTLLRLPLPGGAAAIAELSDLFDGQTLSRPLNWLADALPLLNEGFHLSSADGLLAKLDLTPATPEIHLAIEGSLRQLGAQLSFVYPNPPAAADSLEARLEAIAASLRNPAAESEARKRLREYGFDGELELRGETQIMDFFAGPLPRLEAEWQVEVGERFRHVTRDIQRLRPQLESLGGGEDWFSFSINYSTADGQSLSAGEIRRLLDAGENSTRAGKGKRIAIDRAALDDLQELPCATAIRSNQAVNTRSPQRRPNTSAAHSDSEQINQRGCPATPIKTTLRPYQTDGVAWLYQRLRSPGGRAGAILADEMGLGKTLQALTLISALRIGFPRPRGLPDLPAPQLGSRSRDPSPHLLNLASYMAAPPRGGARWPRSVIMI